MTLPITSYRLLIIDDNEAIHDDLKKILLPRVIDSQLADDEAFLFGVSTQASVTFEIDSAFQGQEGLECVLKAQASGQPYALAFIDVRMPPGWDGIETIGHLWKVDPDLQVVICTAHSDYNWSDISTHLGVSDNFVVLKKPFDIIEATQLAHAMTAKWTSMKQARLRMEELDQLVDERTMELFAANEQTRLLSAALQAAANSVSITDPQGTILWTNPAFSSLYGYSAEEVVGANCRLVKSGLQDKLFYRQLWETISTGKAWRGEIINRRKDGTLIPEEMTITPVTSERGEITHYVAINQDITERKNDENALRQAEEKYRSIFEDAVVGIFQATPEGRLLNTNRAFARMHGYDSPEEIIDKSFEKGRPLIIRPEQFEDWSRQLQQHGVMRSSEVEVQCKDGSRKWVLVNLRAVRDHDGKIVFHEGTVEDITERKLAQEQVDYLAYYDALTGLPNRMMLHERLNSALSAAARRGSRVAVLFLDLDRFKIINDSLGHSFGDLLLQQVASRLQNEIRQHDTVARVGGDEFLIVLTDILSVAEIEVICARIVKSLTGEFAIREHTLNVTCSLGVSIYPQHGNDGETLIKNADAAMYRAKDQGCNIYCFFTDEISAKVVERLNLENSLRLAIDREELFLTYQPQINIETGGIIGLEALVRWQHPERGLVMPDTFIRIAENSGLIISLGEWVLKTACRQMKEWQDCGLRVVPVAVNVSALQFRQNGFRDLIRQVLADTGLAPELLELELTESLLLSNADVMFEVLQNLKDMGLKLVIDDFGTGYSSLSYLRQFPVSKLKIDRSFIRDITVNPDDAAITTAIISLSKGLNLKVIAEGVETEDHLSFLRKHQCDEYQGYFFSRPLKAEDIACLLDRSWIQRQDQEMTIATK
jgi:diguanylate cyclase (GGDEF)-like protein/PAS domain S-box-containing protein